MKTSDLIIIVLLAALLWFVVIEPRTDPAPVIYSGPNAAQVAPAHIEPIQMDTAQAVNANIDAMNTQAAATVYVMQTAIAPAPAVAATSRPSLNEFLGLPSGENAGARNTLVPIPNP